MVITTSFCDYSLTQSPVFEGLKNFKTIFADPDFSVSIVNTLKWVLIQSTLHVGFGFVMALILRRKPKGWKFVRVAYVIPNIIPTAATAVMFSLLLNPSFGVIKIIYEKFGLDTSQVLNLFGNSKYAFITVTATWVFYSGFNMLIFMGEMGAISPDIYEAAMIDGATPTQADRYITIPLMKNAFGTCVILASVAMVSQFDIIYMTTKGGPGNATLWADVGCFAECKDNKYCICAVTGPDEYNAIVDNNFYTNLMARENIRSAMWALDRMKNLDKNAYNKLVEKLELEDEELEYWEKIINNMYFPFDEKLQIYPQDDGFLMRKPWDESKIPEEKRHLLYENYHPLFVYRQRMAKQADAILGMLLHSNFFTEEELKRNYDFYQTVTLHHSSLSTCIFGILASQIGYDEEAYKYFSQSARMDLDDMHDNFYAGIHAANMAGTWQGIVFGFAGVRSNTGELTIHPKLPEQWKSYEFCVEYHGSDMRIKIEQGKVTYKLLNQVPITFKSNHEPITLNKEGEEYVQEI